MVTKEFTKTKKIFFIIFSAIFILSLYYFVIYPVIQPKFFSSEYTYNLFIDTSASLSNVTFLIPLPLQKGKPRLGTKLLAEEMFKKEGFNASFVEWNENVFLKITAEAMVSERNNKYRINVIDYRYVSGISDFANTRYPLGNESVFQPKYNLTTQQTIPLTYSTWYGPHHNPVVIPYQTSIYAEYTTSKDAKVQIFADIDVLNQWVESGTHQGNSFHDSYAKIFLGEARGWYLADGKLETGEGKYLDQEY